MNSIDFEALFSASPNPYVLLDPSFTIVEANEAYLEVTMRERSDLIGRNLFDAFPSDPESDSHRQLLTSLERVVREKSRDHLPLIKYDIPLPEGGFEERYWSATHSPLFDETGEVAFILQHTVDVTELHRLRTFARSTLPSSGASALIATDVLRRAEAVQETNEALEEESQHLRDLFEQAPGFMAVLNGPRHVFAMANAAYLQLVGHRDILGKAVGEALPEIVAQGFIDLLDRVYETGEPFVGRGIRVVLERSPGAEPQERHVDFVFQPIKKPDGSTSGIFVQGHDVTEQKRAEDALRESEERFRLVAESAPVMLWMGDRNGKCLYLNRGLRGYWGVRPEDVGTFDWGPTIHPDDRETLYVVFGEAMQSHSAFSLEARYRRADGEYRILRTEAQPRFARSGEFLGMIGMNIDVTDARRAEAMLRESQERAVEAEAQTRRLAAALAERVSELDAANDEIQRFAYIVSHDLRSPLVNVMGFTSELEGARAEIERFVRTVAQEHPGLVSPEIRSAVESDLPEAIGFIRSSTAKMDRLIAAILRLSREGRRVLSVERISMAELLEVQRQSLAHQLGEREAEIVIEDCPDLFSDRLAVEQIFGNLIENAVKYLSPGRAGRIVVRGREDGAFVNYEVEDNGRGIEPKDFERIFDLFRRSGSQDQPGEGIGLAHVRAVVRRLGGKISVRSRLGEGTVFTVTLPRALGMASEAA